MNILIKLLILIVLSSVCHASENLNVARVSLDEATRQILRESNKRVLGATTEIIDGREVHIIKVLTPDGRIQHYKIDAETGASIS
ncbi:PepSY domain-containing protein [Methyloglobulus sp.]|uniref:PepSY domain-containing protein n=1 Tax=Methyloglobulus sp. TaxID=2518622 RepID=UPI0032B869B9